MWVDGIDARGCWTTAGATETCDRLNNTEKHVDVSEICVSRRDRWNTVKSTALWCNRPVGIEVDEVDDD